MKYSILLGLAGLAGWGLVALRPAWQAIPTNSPGNTDWANYGGNKAGNRYSPLTQINRNTVKNLQVAWTYNAAEADGKTGRQSEIQCQPIVVDGVLFGTTPKLKLFALEASTGKPLWLFDPYAHQTPQYHANRGLMYWADGTDQRVLYTAGAYLYAVKAQTGELVADFGQNGRVDLHEGLDKNLNRDISSLAVSATSPGVIYKDMLIIGSRVAEYGDAAPGHIRAFDVRTGRLKWVFHTIPQPGEFGYDTWPKDAYTFMGGANNWGGMVLDDKRGVVYLGTGSPSVDFYGGSRAGQNLFSDCILALDATTGALKWYFQTVHHDLWDRDLPCPPNLATIVHQGKKVEVVVQTTKDGLTYVLNRDTGKSLFPVVERAVPPSSLPGEHAWPTQRYPLKPAPFSRQVLTEADLTDLSPDDHAFVKARFLQSRSGNKYLPPSQEGTLFYGLGGGAEWGGNAIDPSGILYQNANEMLWDVKMKATTAATDAVATQGRQLYQTNCAVCHGVERKGSGAEFPSLIGIGNRLSASGIQELLQTGRGRMPSFQHLPEKDRSELVRYLLNTEKEPAASTDPHAATGPQQADSRAKFPYVPPFMNNGYTKFLAPSGYPAIKPPWGTLNAIDLNTGELKWKVPLGEFPELTPKGIPPTGTENYGGPIVTAGGLVFIAATYDERIRAFDQQTGKVVWEYQLPAGGFATPITYLAGGRQYVVIAAGGVKNGHKPGGSYIAFALPR